MTCNMEVTLTLARDMLTVLPSTWINSINLFILLRFLEGDNFVCADLHKKWCYCDFVLGDTHSFSHAWPYFVHGYLSPHTRCRAFKPPITGPQTHLYHVEQTQCKSENVFTLVPDHWDSRHLSMFPWDAHIVSWNSVSNPVVLPFGWEMSAFQ